MKLIPFQPTHFQILIDWISDEATMLNFAGIGFSYPLTKAQLQDYTHKHPDRLIYLAMDDDSEPIGYGEIIPQDNDSARLGHLIIGESQQRGKGVGQRLIQLLHQEAKLKLNVKIMELYLLGGNLPAEKCYLKYGFQFIANDFQIAHQKKTYDILKMKLTL